MVSSPEIDDINYDLERIDKELKRKKKIKKMSTIIDALSNQVDRLSQRADEQEARLDGHDRDMGIGFSTAAALLKDHHNHLSTHAACLNSIAESARVPKP